MIRNMLYAFGAAMALASPIAHAQTGIRSHHVSAAGDDAVITVLGSSGCVPPGATAERSGQDIVVRLEPLPPGTACFSVPRPWGVTVVAPDLAADRYEVDVRWGQGDSLGTFSFHWPLTGVTESVHSSFVPTEGMWWSDAAPGTGMAFNVDSEGRWFAALYLYDELGAPTFLTLQGESLTYDFDGPPRRPYAVGVSPLIRSEGGQCLQCPWRNPTIAASGDEAILEFHGRNRAALTVGGSWRLDLTPLPATHADVMQQRALPLDDRHYLLTIDAEGFRHVVTVRAERPEIVVGGLPTAIFHCVDCRSDGDGGDSGGGTAAASDQEIVTFVEETLVIRCFDLVCSATAGNRTGTSFIDMESQTISALLRNVDAPESDPLRLELRLLPEGWRD